MRKTRRTELTALSAVCGPIVVAVLSLGMSQANASSVTFGSFTIDTALAVTSLTDGVGSLNAHHTGSGGYPDMLALPGNILTGYVFNGDTSEDRLTFNDGKTAFTGPNPNASMKGTFGAPIYNNLGVDVYIFESGDAPNPPLNNQFELIAASTSGAAGTWINASQLGFLTQADLGGSNTTFGLYVYGIDLSDLGITDGASLAALYFGNTCGANVNCATANGGGNNPDVELIVGVDGAGSPLSSTPLPAALPLFGSGLGVVGNILGWRKKRKRAAQAAA